MEKKPLVMVVKDAREAAKRLNEFVEKGGYNFDFGVSTEYVTEVTKNSDGTTSEKKEKRFRLTGFVDMYVGEELDSLNAIREDMKQAQKERVEMNRTLNIMNKSAFAPISILLSVVALFLLTFGILTLAKILPLPPEQIGIAIALVIVGALALGGAITLFILRRKKKMALLMDKEKILRQDEELKIREADILNKTPQWYKDALWEAEGYTLKNKLQRHELR